MSMTVTAALTAATAVLALGAGPAAAAGTASGPGAGTARLGDCAAGQFCWWNRPDFRGPSHPQELYATATQACVALPKGAVAASFANRMGRPVTVYQDRECGETGEFDTYPGDGTWVPAAGYQVRAFKVWER